MENFQSKITTLEFLYSILSHRADSSFIENIQSFDFRILYGDKLHIEKMREAIVKVKEKDDKNLLLSEWLCLFRPVAKNKFMPPLESVVMNTDHRELISILNNIYASNNIELSNDYLGRHDYIGTEIAFLLHQYRESLNTNKSESINLFLDNHIELWVPKYCSEAIKNIESEFNKEFVLYLDSLFNKRTGYSFKYKED